MASLVEKVKEKVKDAKDKVVGSKDEDSEYDSTKHYEASEAMSPAKIKEHELTAVRREMTEKITEADKGPKVVPKKQERKLEEAV